MPALSNPKHEAFAQHFVAALAKPNGQGNSATQAYLNAGYKTDRNGARASAARLLAFVSTISERVRELQAQQLARLQPKLDISKERIGRRLDLASCMAEQQQNPKNIVASELGLAKVFHRLDQPDNAPKSFAQAKSMHEIGQLLLAQVGIASPSQDQIDDAIAAHDALIEALQAIAARHDGSQSLTIDR